MLRNIYHAFPLALTITYGTTLRTLQAVAHQKALFRNFLHIGWRSRNSRLFDVFKQDLQYLCGRMIELPFKSSVGQTFDADADALTTLLGWGYPLANLVVDNEQDRLSSFITTAHGNSS